MRLLLLVAALVALSSPAAAQTCTTSWAAATDGAWSDDGNWTAGAPDADDTACITQPGTYTVSLDRDQALAGLVVGGASGTQTLILDRTLTTLGEGTIGENGAVETRFCGTGCGGLRAVTGTLAVEGTLVHREFAQLLSGGGTLDIAPGGLLRVRTGINSVNIGSGSEDSRSRVIVRGTLRFDAEGQTPRSVAVVGTLDLVGGTIAVTDGRISITCSGRWTGGTFDVPEGGYLWFLGGGDAGRYEVSGTYTGTPAGQVQFSSRTSLVAAPGDATFDVGGAGIEVFPGSGQTTFVRSSGGALVNAGRIVVRGNGLWVDDATLRNEGTLDVYTNGILQNDGEIVNTSAGTLQLLDGGGITGGDNGRLVNRGEVVAVLDANTAARSTISTRTDVDGGRFEAATADLFLASGGTWTNPEVAVAEGRDLAILNGAAGGVYELAGTLSGDPVGSLRVSRFAQFAAAPGDGTLDVGGTGLAFDAGSGQTAVVTSAGGEMVNTGRVVVRGNGLWVQGSILRNEGMMEVRTSLRMPLGGVVRNEGTIELVQGGGASSSDGTGRLVNASLIVARRELPTGFSQSTFGFTLRSEPGSELRTLKGARLQLDTPVSTSLPAGVRLTGDGESFVPFGDFFIEGTVSPGTEAAPIDTLRHGSWLRFSNLTGSPRLIVDVGPDGRSDLLEVQRGGGAAGSVRLAGALIVRVAEGYTPQPGDTFTVLRTINTTNDIEDDFDVVLAEGAPAGIAFVAERNADNSEILVRAVSVDASGDFQVSTDAILGGATRSVFLSGPGAGGVTAARLECVECLDDEAFGTLPAAVSEGESLREVRVDVTSPRAYGFYDLVLERDARPDTTVALTVRPFLSFISFLSGADRGVGVRPAGLRYNWSQFTVTNTSNTDAPGFMVGAVNREAPDKVDFALAPSNPFFFSSIYYESETANDPDAAAMVLGRVAPGQGSRLAYGQRIDPADVLFPEQTRTGPDDDRIPFQGPLVFSGLVAHHLSFERTLGLMVEALESTGDATLDGYLADLETADPGAVERGVGLALLLAPNYTLGPGLFFERVLDRFGEVVAQPSGLEAAVGPFARALDAAAGRHLVDIYQAHEVDFAVAPEAVRQLLVDEFEALGGYGSAASLGSGTAARAEDSTAACAEGGAGGGPFNNESAARAYTGALQSEVLAEANRQIELIRAHEAVHMTQQECKRLEDLVGSGGDGLGRQDGTCSPPPPPPGGPPGGGGNACGGPSAPADPNDKTVPASRLMCEFGTVTVDGEEVSRCVRYFVPLADATEAITYTIDFENLPLATANAEFITITDDLDPNLDPSTLEVYATSSDSTFSYTTSGQTVTFRFIGIDLPPNVTDPEGKGFVTFGVRPRAGLAAGTEIRNDASIVFDFNPAIETPEVVHEIREAADLATALVTPDFSSDGAIPFRAVAVNGQGDPASKAVLTVSAGAPIVSASPEVGTCSGTGTQTVTCEVGTLAAGEAVRVDLALDGSATGVYTVSSSVASDAFDGFAANDTDLAEIAVSPVSAEDGAEGLRDVTLAHPAPNPVRGPVTLRWGLPRAGRAHVRVFDMLGRKVAEVAPDADVAAGWQTQTWTPALASGVYVVRLDAEVGGRAEVRTRRLVVIR